MGIQYNPTIVTDGLVLCLDAANVKSYPGTGTAWTDLSGNGNTGTLTNGPTFGTANGGSIAFDGTDDFIIVPSSSVYGFGTGDFTIECWYYATSYSGYNHLLAIPSQGTFALKANTGDGAIYFYSPTWTTYGSTPGWTLTLNAWNHVVFVRRSSIGYAYLNGTSYGAKSGFTNNFTANTVNIHNGNSGEFVACNISSVKLYNVGLTENQVKQNFNAVRGRYGL